MKLIVSKEWLRRRIASDPDVETDAGVAVACLDGLVASPAKLQTLPGTMAPASDPRALRLALARVVRALRTQKHVSIHALAQQLDVESAHLEGLEEDPSFVVPPRTLSRIAKHFDLPISEIVMLSGATKVTDRMLVAQAVKFAARSAELTAVDEEGQQALFAFVRFLTNRAAR